MKTIKETIIKNLQTIYNAEIIPKMEYNFNGDLIEVFTNEVLLKFNYVGTPCYLWVGPNGKMVWSVSNYRRTAHPVSGKLVTELKTEKNND